MQTTTKYIENLKYNHTGTKNTESIYLQKKIHCIAKQSPKLHFVTLTYMKLNRNTMNSFVNCAHHFAMESVACVDISQRSSSDWSTKR